MSAFEKYVVGVGAGTIPAGKLIRAAIARHLRDLETCEERGLFFDTKAAEHAIKFFPLLKHSKGKSAESKFKLEPWQAFVVGSIFGWKKRDGLRRFRVAYVEVPRKNGKSTIAAGIALYCLVADKEPGAEVYIAAT